MYEPNSPLFVARVSCEATSKRIHSDIATVTTEFTHLELNLSAQVGHSAPFRLGGAIRGSDQSAGQPFRANNGEGEETHRIPRNSHTVGD